MPTRTYHQAYDIQLYVQLVKIGSVDLSLVKPNAGFGAGKFMDGSTLMPSTNTVVQAGEGTNYKLFSGTPKTVTKVAVASNVVTLTFAAAHGIANGATIVVKDIPAPNTALNGVFTVASVSTVSPFTLTYALTTANVSETTVVAGSAMSGVLLLDGTDPPVKLQGLQNCSRNSGSNNENTITYDSDARGYDQPVATSSTVSWTVSGQTNYLDPAFWLMVYGQKDMVDQQLLLKYCRVGPRNTNLAYYGYGMIPTFEEPSEAGSIIKYNSNIEGYGGFGIEK